MIFFPKIVANTVCSALNKEYTKAMSEFIQIIK